MHSDLPLGLAAWSGDISNRFSPGHYVWLEEACSFLGNPPG